MAGRKQTRQRQGTPKAQDAHEEQEPKVDYTLPSKDKLPPEVADLMELSFAEIEQLPEDKKQLIYAEVGRQAAGLAAKAGSGFDALSRQFLEITEKAGSVFSGLGSSVMAFDITKINEALQRVANAGVVLQPYIDRMVNADPDRWRHASLPEVYAAAAKVARDDGVDVPPLWCEEQEDFPFDLQRFGEAEQQEATKEESSLTPAELLGTLKTIQAINPTSHVMPNNPLMNTLTQKPAINTGPFDLPIWDEDKTKKRKELTNYTIVTYDPGDSGITITDPKLSEYERQVSDAVISIWVEAERQNVLPLAVTVDMIYRAMPGGGDRPQPAQRAAIIRTIEKLRGLHIYMDATEEMRKRGKNGMAVMDDFYFKLTRFQYNARNSRQKITKYVLNDVPIMLYYSQMTGQLLTVQAKYLEIRKVKGGNVSPELIPATAGRQAMTGYMMRRIAVMRYDEKKARDALRHYNNRRKKETDLEAKPLEAFRKQSRTILFDTLFSEAGTASDNRAQIKDNRDYCFSVLEYWQAAGLIKGYAEQRKGKKITGVDITVDPC